MSEKKTLYCFKLNKETGEVKRIEINNYASGMWNNKKQWFRFRSESVIYYAYSQDFDRFKNDRVYSFNDDMNHAIEIMYQTLMEKSEKEYRDYQKHHNLMCEISERYMNNEVAT